MSNDSESNSTQAAEAPATNGKRKTKSAKPAKKEGARSRQPLNAGRVNKKAEEIATMKRAKGATHSAPGAAFAISGIRD